MSLPTSCSCLLVPYSFLHLFRFKDISCAMNGMLLTWQKTVHARRTKEEIGIGMYVGFCSWRCSSSMWIMDSVRWLCYRTPSFVLLLFQFMSLHCLEMCYCYRDVHIANRHSCVTDITTWLTVCLRWTVLSYSLLVGQKPVCVVRGVDFQAMTDLEGWPLRWIRESPDYLWLSFKDCRLCEHLLPRYQSQQVHLSIPLLYTMPVL